MSLTVPNTAEIIMLQYIMGLTSPGNKILRLYNNDPSISDSTTLGSLTEATEDGYAPVTLYSISWTISQDMAGVTTALYSEMPFNFTTGATIYGYYITSAVGNNLLWVERFSGAPYQLPASGGGQIAVEARTTLD